MDEIEPSCTASAGMVGAVKAGFKDSRAGRGSGKTGGGFTDGLHSYIQRRVVLVGNHVDIV